MFRKECQILLLGVYLHFNLTLYLFHFYLMTETHISGIAVDFLQLLFSSLCSHFSYSALRSGGSRQSTIDKQMIIVHQNGFTMTELITFCPTIYWNTLDSTQPIVLQMCNMNVQCVMPVNCVCSLLLLRHMYSTQTIHLRFRVKLKLV
jgi:hypothetical protein